MPKSWERCRLNGGAYNALLNTTSKYRASIAACLTILSYMATAVISSNEAMHYLHSLWASLPVIWATIGLLALFMFLAIIGITESSIVAIIIFVFHLTSMLLLMTCGLFALTNFGLDVLWTNLQTPTEGGIWKAIFLTWPRQNGGAAWAFALAGWKTPCTGQSRKSAIRESPFSPRETVSAT